MWKEAHAKTVAKFWQVWDLFGKTGRGAYRYKNWVPSSEEKAHRHFFKPKPDMREIPFRKNRYVKALGVSLVSLALPSNSYEENLAYYPMDPARS